MILSFPPGTPQKTSDRVTEKVHTLLQSDFKGWGCIFPKGSPCEFTLDLKGMQYYYAKGAKEARVSLSVYARPSEYRNPSRSMQP
jgi:hypothetical protein